MARNKGMLSSQNGARELEEINKMRKMFNMPLIKRGNKICKRCGETFYAMDMLNQYFCSACNNTMSGQIDPYGSRETN